MTGDGNGPMGLRASHQAAVLTAGDIALIRQVLTACSRVLDWAGQHAGPQYRDIADAAVQAAITELLLLAGYEGSAQAENTMRWLLAMRQDDGGWAIPPGRSGCP